MEDQQLIEKIEKECEELSAEIISKSVKRIFRGLNSMGAETLSEDYPTRFTFVDVLSIECQTKSWEEIHPALHETIWNYIDSEIQELPKYESLTLRLTSVYEYGDNDVTYITNKLYEAFCDALNDHYEKTKKIQRFVEHCDWL